MPRSLAPPQTDEPLGWQVKMNRRSWCQGIAGAVGGLLCVLPGCGGAASPPRAAPTATSGGTAATPPPTATISSPEVSDSSTLESTTVPHLPLDTTIDPLALPAWR